MVQSLNPLKKLDSEFFSMDPNFFSTEPTKFFSDDSILTLEISSNSKESWRRRRRRRCLNFDRRDILPRKQLAVSSVIGAMVDLALYRAKGPVYWLFVEPGLGDAGGLSLVGLLKPCSPGFIFWQHLKFRKIPPGGVVL